MKLKVSKTIEEEVELSLPAYRKGVCHYFKIISEELAIQVTDLDKWSGISQVSASIAFNHGNDECTPEEFKSKFTEVNLRLLETVVPNPDDFTNN